MGESAVSAFTRGWGSLIPADSMEGQPVTVKCRSGEKPSFCRYSAVNSPRRPSVAE